jgi:hypothetical protein
VKSKKIIGSFWIGSFDTTFSQQTRLVSALERLEIFFFFFFLDIGATASSPGLPGFVADI